MKGLAVGEERVPCSLSKGSVSCWREVLAGQSWSLQAQTTAEQQGKLSPCHSLALLQSCLEIETSLASLLILPMRRPNTL